MAAQIFTDSAPVLSKGQAGLITLTAASGGESLQLVMTRHSARMMVETARRFLDCVDMTEQEARVVQLDPIEEKHAEWVKGKRPRRKS